ncbi:MAG: cysteine peptidase family C39 domain-containing protein [Spirochaetia bacterium]|jgi:predicted double-glycine peptidase|nr:cysteine peptidase family C39 domain-containing protein [Spirochaetia bacterium]
MWSIHSSCIGLTLLLALGQPVPKEDLRFIYVMEQGMDASCGMATVATALSLYWHIPVREAELLAGLFPTGSEVEGRNNGTVSLASMAAAFEGKGIAARAFRVDWDGLETILARGYAPLVVHYDRPDPHFALLLEISGDVAVLADPARGLETLDRAGLEKRYSGVAMALASHSGQRDNETLEAAIRAARGRRALLEGVGMTHPGPGRASQPDPANPAGRMWPGW